MRRTGKSMDFAGKIELYEKKVTSEKEHALRSKPATGSEKELKDEMMQLAIDYYNSGKSLEELDEKIRNHHFFIIGYERAKRLAYIKELEQQERGKSR